MSMKFVERNEDAYVKSVFVVRLDKNTCFSISNVLLLSKKRVQYQPSFEDLEPTTFLVTPTGWTHKYYGISRGLKFGRSSG